MPRVKGESPEARARRVMEQRVNTAAKALRAVGELSTKFTYPQQSIAKLDAFLKAETQKALNRLAQPVAKEETPFTL